MTGDFSKNDIKKAGINEIFQSEEGDKWYKCKVNFISIDEVNATEKKIRSKILVLASDIKSAWDNLKISLKDTMSDYDVPSIMETQILDIFPYSIEEDSKEISEEEIESMVE